MDPGGKTDGVIIDASVAREATPRDSGWSWGQSPLEIFWSLSDLALPGRRFNRIFTDSYNKFSRLTLKKWENKN